VQGLRTLLSCLLHGKSEKATVSVLKRNNTATQHSAQHNIAGFQYPQPKYLTCVDRASPPFGLPPKATHVGSFTFSPSLRLTSTNYRKCNHDHDNCSSQLGQTKHVDAPK
jgi:hypothetical protein